MRARPALGRTAPDAPQQRGALEAGLTESRGKQSVVLEAIPPAALVQELVLEVAERQTDGAAGLDRQVLEEKCLAMRNVQPTKRVDRRGRGRRLTNPPEVVVESHDVLPIIAKARAADRW